MISTVRRAAMIVKELIEQLSKMPEDAIVVTAKDPKGSWTVTKKATKAKYEHLDICIIQECAP